jgi:L-fuconolactonase
MAVVDAHHHLWDPARRDYPWLAREGLAPIRKAYRLTDLRHQAAGAGVDRTILVQTVAGQGETEEFLSVAAESAGLVAGVVGWVDLTAAGVTDRLQRLREMPGGAMLAGIRHQVEDEPDPDWLLRPEVLRGLRAVGAAGLVYDLLVRPPQLAAAIEVARALDNVTLVLDHAGKPPIASGDLEPWRSRLSALASLPHVRCKLSGLVTEARWDAWSIRDLRPYAEHVLASFGPDRVMFGSDWPVCELAASYRDVVALASDLLATRSAAERSAVMARTAITTYDLDRST